MFSSVAVLNISFYFFLLLKKEVSGDSGEAQLDSELILG